MTILRPHKIIQINKNFYIIRDKNFPCVIRFNFNPVTVECRPLCREEVQGLRDSEGGGVPW